MVLRLPPAVPPLFPPFPPIPGWVMSWKEGIFFFSVVLDRLTACQCQVKAESP